jgi:hypothetical protein
MADLSDVEAALVAVISALVYPAGAGTASALNFPAKVFRGQPAGNMLLDDGRAGVADVSVFAVPDRAKNTTRWGVQTSITHGTPGISVNVAGNCATFSGVATAGDLAGVLVNQSAYVYATQPGDSAALVAAALGDAIRTNGICWVSDASLTVPGALSLIARTVAPAKELQEWSRQEQEFRISVWTGTPQMRDAACSLIGAGLAAIPFLELADGTGGRLRYSATKTIDDDQASSIYRRDLIYIVEYGTTVTATAPTVLFPDLNWNGETFFV